MHIIKFTLSFIAGLLISVSSMSGANAHDNAYFDAMKSANGGQTRMAGALHLELVLVKDSKMAKENAVIVYVTDHAGKAIATNGATASLAIVQGKNKLNLNLVPEGENRLVGKAVYASEANLKAALTVTMMGKGAEQARFTPFAIVKKVEVKNADGHEHKH
jgi:nitrogen fixation protein FixH